MRRIEFVDQRRTDRIAEQFKQDAVAAVLGIGAIPDDEARQTVRRFIARGFRGLSAEEHLLIEGLIATHVPKECPNCGGFLPPSEWTQAVEEGRCSWCPGEPLAGLKIVRI